MRRMQKSKGWAWWLIVSAPLILLIAGAGFSHSIGWLSGIYLGLLMSRPQGGKRYRWFESFYTNTDTRVALWNIFDIAWRFAVIFTIKRILAYHGVGYILSENAALFTCAIVFCFYPAIPNPGPAESQDEMQTKPSEITLCAVTALGCAGMLLCYLGTPITQWSILASAFCAGLALVGIGSIAFTVQANNATMTPFSIACAIIFVLNWCLIGIPVALGALIASLVGIIVGVAALVLHFNFDSPDYHRCL